MRFNAYLLKQSYSFPEGFSQNDHLPIRIVSPDFGHLPKEAAAKYGLTQRLPYYFFLLMLDGVGQYSIDGNQIDIAKDDLLFATPHQIQALPTASHGNDYYKIGFDEECLSRLPGNYPFLLNPLAQNRISFSPSAANRLQAIFKILQELLLTTNTDAELILAHLNSLLTEINSAYFRSERRPADDRMSKFIGFKLFVENNFTDHPTIQAIAEELAVSTDSLYQMVKQYSGLSPKEYVTNRLILEARRRLINGQHSSVKELSYDLGFNDPAYFSRLFKKVTGKTVAGFFQDLSKP